MSKEIALFLMTNEKTVIGYAARGHVDKATFAKRVGDLLGLPFSEADVEHRHYRIGRKPGASDGVYWHVRSEVGHGSAPYTVVDCRPEATPRPPLGSAQGTSRQVHDG